MCSTKAHLDILSCACRTNRAKLTGCAACVADHQECLKVWLPKLNLQVGADPNSSQIPSNFRGMFQYYWARVEDLHRYVIGQMGGGICLGGLATGERDTPFLDH